MITERFHQVSCIEVSVCVARANLTVEIKRNSLVNTSKLDDRSD